MNIKRALSFFPAAIGFGFGSLGRGFQAGLTGQWEGWGSSRNRQSGGKRTESQDTSLNFGVREGLLSEARRLAQTFPIVGSINRKYANHCVGSCRMKWCTGDIEIDKAYSDAWQSWMAMADKKGKHHFRKLTKLAVEGIIGDGGIVGHEDRRGGFLQIDNIEYDRISSHGSTNSDTLNLVGGFGLDANGREIFARVWNRTLFGMFDGYTEIPRNQYAHAFDSKRSDAIKGVTAYHSVLNTIRDLKETGDAERLSAKRNSKLALLVKTVMGGAAAPVVNLYENDVATPDGEYKINVEQVGDAATAYMLPSEEMKAHTSERPSEGWRWLMEWLVREIATGLNLPFGLVWHMAGLPGPAVRFEIGQANRTFFSFLQDVLEPMWYRPIVGAWVTTEIAAGRLDYHPNWYCFKVPRPASLTIDLGRDSKSGIAENAAGLTTATDWYAEDDKSFEDEVDTLVYEAKYREAARLGIPIAEVKEVPLEQIRILTQQGNPPSADAQQDEPTSAPGPQKKAPTKAEIETAITPEAVLPKKRKYIVKRDAKGRMEELEEVPC